MIISTSLAFILLTQLKKKNVFNYLCFPIIFSIPTISMCRSWPVFCGKFINVGGLSSFLPYFKRKALGQEMPVFALETLMKLPALGILKSIKKKNIKKNKEIYYVYFIEA